MNRRNLLKGLLGLAVAPLAAKVLPVLPKRNPEEFLSGSAIALLDAHQVHVYEHLLLRGWGPPNPDAVLTHIAEHQALFLKGDA